MDSVHYGSGAFRKAISRCWPFSMLLLFATAVVVSAAPSFAADGNLVEKIIQAYGGREALSDVAALRAEGTIETFMPEDHGSYVYLLKRDGRLLVDIRYTNRSEKRILDGNKGYRGTDEEVEAVSGPAFLAMIYQYDQLDLPYGLLGNTFRVSYVKKDLLRGRDVDIMMLTDRSGNEIEIAVDRETHFIVKTSATFTMGEGKAVLSSEFTDFRKIGGIVFPFTIVNYADQFKISNTTIAKYTVNPEIDAAAFSP